MRNPAKVFAISPCGKLSIAERRLGSFDYEVFANFGSSDYEKAVVSTRGSARMHGFRAILRPFKRPKTVVLTM